MTNHTTHRWRRDGYKGAGRMKHQCPDCASDMEDDGVWCWCSQAGCSFTGYVEKATGDVDYPYAQPEMCEACEKGQCWDCGMQTWCECECAGSEGCYAFDPFDEPIVAHTKETDRG